MTKNLSDARAILFGMLEKQNEGTLTPEKIDKACELTHTIVRTFDAEVAHEVARKQAR